MKRFLKALLLTCALVIPLAALVGQLPAVLAAIASFSPWLLGVVILGLVAYALLNASVWTDVLAGLGHRSGRFRATRLWIRSEAMKWLPGGVWGYASRVVSAPAIGVGKSTAGASLLVELLLTVGAWGALAAIGLAGAGRIVLDGLPVQPGHSVFPAVLAAGAGLLAVMFAVRKPVARALTSRLSLLKDISWRPGPLGRAFLSYLLLCSFHVFLLQVLVMAVRPGTADWFFFASAGGLAWLLGFFAIGVPGGIGVREAGLAWFLSHAMAMPEAMAVAVLWRAMQVAAEMTSLGLTFAIRPTAGAWGFLRACPATP